MAVAKVITAVLRAEDTQARGRAREEGDVMSKTTYCWECPRCKHFNRDTECTDCYNGDDVTMVLTDKDKREVVPLGTGAELKRLKAELGGRKQLLAAYRIGSQQMADKALLAIERAQALGKEAKG